MLTSLALVFLCGLALGGLCRRLRLPPLLGMLLTGILLGPSVLNLLDTTLLSVSADLRQIALIIILMRAGLGLDLAALRRVGRPAVLMCFVPALCEIAGIALLAPPLLGFSVPEALVLGAVVAAVSPAVIVPKMLQLSAEGYGTAQGIPQLILAGAALDDVFVLVLFTAFTGLAKGEGMAWGSLVQIPVSIALGIAGGTCVGLALARGFGRFHLRDTAKVVVLLSVSFLLVGLQNALEGTVPFSGLLAVMSMGAVLSRTRVQASQRLSNKFSKLWVGAEVLLFVLVGAAVDVRYALAAGLAAVALLAGALVFRMGGVALCLVKTPLKPRERAFCMVAYCPKATVQAAIGAVPLAMGLSCGPMVLTVAVLSILLTAPLGALGIDCTYKRWLQKTPVENCEKEKKS